MDKRELVGKRVVVQNPLIPDARWEGFCYGYATFPTVDLELADGLRISLPAAWAEEVK